MNASCSSWTRIVLELLLNQANATSCEELLTFLETAKPCCFISSFHVFTIILVIQHKAKDLSLAKKFIESIQSYSGLSVFHPGYQTMLAAVDAQTQYNLDFDDGLTVAAMQELNITEIISFDTHYDHVQGISRIDPIAALNKLQKL